MNATKLTFEERKEIALRSSISQGVVDVVHGSTDEISLETLELWLRSLLKNMPRRCIENWKKGEKRKSDFTDLLLPPA